MLKNVHCNSILVVRIIVLIAVFAFVPVVLLVNAQTLPIDLDRLEKGRQITNPLDSVFKYQTILVHLTEKDIKKGISGYSNGLIIDFSKIKSLVDGRDFDPNKLRGEVSYGAYPFAPSEINFEEKYFQAGVEVKEGKAFINLNNLLNSLGNVNKWTNSGSIVIRFKLIYENKFLGAPDTYTAFEKSENGFQKLPWFTEWPSINNLNSENPTQATLCFRTDSPVMAKIKISEKEDIQEDEARMLHEVNLKGLEPGKSYTYQIEIEKIQTKSYSFKAAPKKGEQRVIFAVAGDSGSDFGIGMQNYLGCNYETRQSLLKVAKKKNCEFLLELGDMVRGYAVDKCDFEGQLMAAKDSLSPFWRNCPVYTLVGNHEMLCNVFYFLNLRKQNFVQIDKWPYKLDSTEAVFRKEFYNPPNAPEPSDSRRPPYNGTVYSFIYGSVKIIVMNNDYWFSRYPEKYGGAPYGVIFDDQMNWLEKEIMQADADESIKFIFAAMHCPPFPASEDAHMWRFGNNSIRAYTYNNGKLTPQNQGLIDQRNRLAVIFASSPKLAAVFSGHEHNYSRRLIDQTVPAGVPSKDDLNGNGIIDWPKEKASSIEELKYPVWYIVSGSSGSRPCAGQNSPWDNYLKDKSPELFKFSIQHHLLVLETFDGGVSLKVLNSMGETLDKIPNLMEVKKG